VSLAVDRLEFRVREKPLYVARSHMMLVGTSRRGAVRYASDHRSPCMRADLFIACSPPNPSFDEAERFRLLREEKEKIIKVRTRTNLRAGAFECVL
jgi:hypothetical protein